MCKGSPLLVSILTMKMKKSITILIFLCSLLSVSAQGDASGVAAGERQHGGQRGRLFEWGNYAMFIHWGLYSQLANVWDGRTYYGASEWLLNPLMANANADEYRAKAKTFNPAGFDAMKIAQLAKDAGMKYIIITSKHHDGFAMYHSKCDKFNIVDATPFGRDPMKELSAACRKLGLGFGFYYSHNKDWTTPGAADAPRVDRDGNPRTFDDYFQSKCLPQVEEITRNYGDMELIWFDTPGGMPEKYAKKLVEVVHRNQPGAMVSGRVGYGLGDYKTLGDMEVPLENVDGLWESVDVTNDSWGFAWYDRNWKSPATILHRLVSTVARGGTYMLNVGPDGMGVVPEPVQQSLRESGKWVARYPQVVYGAGASPWRHAQPWGDIVKQGGRLFLCVYEWPKSGSLYLSGLLSPVKKAYVLSGDGRRVAVRHDSFGGWLRLHVPYRQPDRLVSVIELDMAGAAVDVDTTQPLDAEYGQPVLSAKFAEADSCTVTQARWMEKFGEWKYKYRSADLARGGRLVWTLDVQRPGTYMVKVEARGEGRSAWRLTTDEGEYVHNQQSASSHFEMLPLGWIKFAAGGKHRVWLTAPEGGKCEVSAVSLVPVNI